MAQNATPPEIASVVGRNIRAMLDARAQFERTRTVQDRVAARITAFTGSMLFVYLHVAFYGAWVVLNAGPLHVKRPWDPFPFVLLAVVGTVEAIFLSTFVLINQNRAQKLADRRADLDLQVNLLAEREVTRVLAAVHAIARRVGAETSTPRDLEAFEQDVAPEQVLEEIERAEDEVIKSDPRGPRSGPPSSRG